MVTVEINVTKKDIGQGICQSGSNCPIALAAIRTGFREVDVDSFGIGFEFGEVDDDGFYYDSASVRLPKEAKEFIYKFDDNEAVKPFTFRIRLKNSIAKQLKLRKSAIVAA